ncbi:MAG: RICIN domain-containing protein [Clostridia bacterium]|nr:RICIN domain-containing protein [Clostridia bacterium]
MAGAPDSYLSKRTTTEAGVRAQWILYQYTGAARSGTSISYPSSWTSIGIIQGSSTLVGVKTWSTVIGVNTPYVQVAPGYEHIATYSWDATNFKMTLNANAVGTIRTYTRIKYNNDSDTVYTGTSTFTIIPQVGMYYLQNQGTDKYAGIANGNIVSGTAIQQFDFDASNNMQWIIEHVTDSGGYVRIQSFYSALYMSLNASNLSIVEQSYTNEYNLWKFETMTDGNVKVICKATEASNAVMSVPSSASANGANLSMSTYVDNSDLNDEWKCFLQTNDIYLEVIYEMAYQSRYSNAATRTNNQMLKLQELYATEFGILVYGEIPSLFYSYADSHCLTPYYEVCPHISDDAQCRDSVCRSLNNIILYEYHHKNIYNILARIPYSDTTHSVKIAYIGHEVCTQKNEIYDENENLVSATHTANPFYGLCNRVIGVAVILNRASEASETKTVVHEFGHYFGVIDHYGQGGLTTEAIKAETGDNGYSSDCIYGEHKDYTTVMNNLIICDGCKNIIKKNASWFSID